MKKDNNILYLGILFLASLLVELYAFLQLSEDTVVIIGTTIIVLVMAYLFWDSLYNKIIGYKIQEKEENETRWAELEKLQKAIYMANRNNAKTVEESIEVQKKQTDNFLEEIKNIQLQASKFIAKHSREDIKNLVLSEQEEFKKLAVVWQEEIKSLMSTEQEETQKLLKSIEETRDANLQVASSLEKEEGSSTNRAAAYDVAAITDAISRNGESIRFKVEGGFELVEADLSEIRDQFTEFYKDWKAGKRDKNIITDVSEVTLKEVALDNLRLDETENEIISQELELKEMEDIVASEEPEQKELEDEVISEEPEQKELEDEVISEEPEQKELEDEVISEEPEQKELEDEVISEEPEQKELEDGVISEEPEQKELEDEVISEELEQKELEDEVISEELEQKELEDKIISDVLDESVLKQVKIEQSNIETFTDLSEELETANKITESEVFNLEKNDKNTTQKMESDIMEQVNLEENVLKGSSIDNRDVAETSQDEFENDTNILSSEELEAIMSSLMDEEGMSDKETEETKKQDNIEQVKDEQIEKVLWQEEQEKDTLTSSVEKINDERIDKQEPAIPIDTNKMLSPEEVAALIASMGQ